MNSRSLPLLLVLLPLGGCFGTPHLLAPQPDSSRYPSPSIADVKAEIACELVKYKHDQKASSGRFQGKYVVTATLLLQVDEYLDVTPTLNIIAPLIPSPDKRTFLASADIGGQRERTYTETFYIDSERLATDDAFLKSTCSDKQLETDRFSLKGDLKLSEIVDNGERSLGAFEPFGPKAPGPSTNPTFGSTLEFIVTRSVSALGVQWEMGRFKGPSGSNGLINGKRVTTDKLIITFTKVLASKPSETASLTKAIDDLRRAYERRTAAIKAQTLAAAEIKKADDQMLLLQRFFADKRNVQTPALRSQLSIARNDASNGQRTLEIATREVNDADQAVRDAQAIAAVTADTVNRAPAANSIDDAARSNLLLQQTMILQSLNIQPR